MKFLLSLQASEDAKKLVNQERSFACAEIESARAVVQRFGEALEEEERISHTSGKQVYTELFDLHVYKYTHTHIFIQTHIHICMFVCMYLHQNSCTSSHTFGASVKGLLT